MYIFVKDVNKNYMIVIQNLIVDADGQVMKKQKPGQLTTGKTQHMVWFELKSYVLIVVLIKAMSLMTDQQKLEKGTVLIPLALNLNRIKNQNKFTSFYLHL